MKLVFKLLKFTVNIDIPAESLFEGDELALARTNRALESMEL